MSGPVEIFDLGVNSGLGVHSECEIVSEREVDALFEDSSGVDEYFCFLLGHGLFIKLIVEEEDGFQYLEYVSLADGSHDANLFCQ